MADFPTVLTGMLPDSALRMGVRLSKELLRKHAARVKGDKALIDAAVSSAWVTTLRHDTCGVAPYKSETEGDFSELLVVGVQAHTEITPAQIARLQQLIHIAVQYPLLLAVDAGNAVYLSLLQQGAPLEALLRAQALPTVPEFFCYVAWQQEARPPHLMALFHRWACALHALALMQNKPAVCADLPFVPLDSPLVAAQLVADLHRLNQEWKAVSQDLKKTTNPQQRITLSKKLRHLGIQIYQLLQIHNILP
ncbi:MAG: DUF4391 domain-containing protein [Akkermansia sp.]|nr:DUF4391 domain-containing protein [Akkermansia sp.]